MEPPYVLPSKMLASVRPCWILTWALRFQDITSRIKGGQLARTENRGGRSCPPLLYQDAVLPAVNQYPEVVRIRPRQRIGLLLAGSGRRIEIGCAQIKIVSLRIKRHCFGAVLSLNRFHFAQLVG